MFVVDCSNRLHVWRDVLKDIYSSGFSPWGHPIFIDRLILLDFGVFCYQRVGKIFVGSVSLGLSSLDLEYTQRGVISQCIHKNCLLGYRISIAMRQSTGIPNSRIVARITSHVDPVARRAINRLSDNSLRHSSRPQIAILESQIIPYCLNRRHGCPVHSCVLWLLCLPTHREIRRCSLGYRPSHG